MTDEERRAEVARLDAEIAKLEDALREITFVESMFRARPAGGDGSESVKN